MFSSGDKGEHDVIEATYQRFANVNRNTDPRSPIIPRRHRRQRRVMEPMNVARSGRRLQRHCTRTGTGCCHCPTCMLLRLPRHECADLPMVLHNTVTSYTSPYLITRSLGHHWRLLWPVPSTFLCHSQLSKSANSSHVNFLYYLPISPSLSSSPSSHCAFQDDLCVTISLQSWASWPLKGSFS